MSSFIRGLEHLKRARARCASIRDDLSPRLLVDDERASQTFRSGDVVRDSVTGGSGRVERVETKRVLIPPPGG